MASNRIGIVEILLGVVVAYAAYGLMLYATHTPHIHGDEPIEVSLPATSESDAQR
jgi:hypothetical protein